MMVRILRGEIVPPGGLPEILAVENRARRPSESAVARNFRRVVETSRGREIALTVISLALKGISPTSDY